MITVQRPELRFLAGIDLYAKSLGAGNIENSLFGIGIFISQ
jgi:hypothetical protein